MAAQSVSRSNNKLYLQLSAGLNHLDYCRTKSWIPVDIPAGGKKGKQTQRDKYWLPFNRNRLRELIFITYGASLVPDVKEKKPQFLQMWTVVIEFSFLFFLSTGFLPQMCTLLLSKSLQWSCCLLSCEAPSLELTKPSNGASEDGKWWAACVQQPLRANESRYVTVFHDELKKIDKMILGIQSKLSLILFIIIVIWSH